MSSIEDVLADAEESPQNPREVIREKEDAFRTVAEADVPFSDRAKKALEFAGLEVDDD